MKAYWMFPIDQTAILIPLGWRIYWCGITLTRDLGIGIILRRPVVVGGRSVR